MMMVHKMSSLRESMSSALMCIEVILAFIAFQNDKLFTYRNFWAWLLTGGWSPTQ